MGWGGVARWRGVGLGGVRCDLGGWTRRKCCLGSIRMCWFTLKVKLD